MAVPCFHLFVTNFVKEGQFLKVIGHKDRRTVKTVEQTILQSFQSFEKGNGVPDPASLRPGLMCCARYTDGAYYRVRVTHVDWTNGFCLVYFIDYGNGDRVAMADIRLVDPSSPVMRLPAQATSYFLAGVISTWDQMLLNHLKQLILYNELKAVVCQTIGQTDVVRLYLDGDKEFSDFLVRQGMATYVAPEAFESMVWRNIAAPTHPVSDAYPYAGYVSPVHQRPAFPVFSAVPPVVALQQPVMPSPPPPLAAVNMRATSFPTYPTLDKNSEHKVFVSHCHCDNGSVTFYAQLNTPEVEKLSNGLNNPASNFTNLSPPLFPGQLCVARYTEDEQLYRAVITDVTDKVSVYFVDYGNKDSVNPGSIYEIPSEYTHIQVMAIPLALANWEKVDWSNEVSEIVTAVINEQNATLKVSPSQELSTKQYCDLFIDETNVIELINVELLKRKPKLAFRNIPVPTAGGKVKVIVTFVKSLDNFYVQLSANEDDLNAMMELVKSHCNGPAGRMQPHEIQPGAACCALYKEDDEWYRGMITDASTDEPSVLYVDFGNIERVPIADLRVANEQIVSQLLTQAIPCRLPGFDGKPDDQLTARFKELAEGNTFTMHVLKLVEEVPYIVVRLFDDSREDILQKLQSAPIHQINGHTIAPPSNVKVAMGDSGAREVSIKLDCPKKDPAAWGLGIHQVNSNHNINVDNNINIGHCDRVSNSKYHTESQVPERRHYVPRLITPDYSSILTIGDRKPVLISFSNGPSDFHVQFKPTAKFDSLGEQLEHSFADGGEVLDRSLVQIGTACVARYPVDEMFYRAEIKEVHNDGATVNFVDYGNIERVSFADLKKIPESLCQLPVQAFHCSLKGVPSSEDNIVKLDTFVESQSLEVELLELDGNLFHVILWDCNSPVSINEQCGALLSPESVSIADASVPLGCTEEVVVTYFKSLQYFCVMQMSVRNDFNSMMTNLQGSYQNKEPVASPSVGQSVVVRYSDGAFYRAKVLIQRDGKYGVICCDYGNKYLASPSHIFALEERYSGLPAAAIQCSFKEPIPKPTNSWATSDLSELLTGNLSCTFLSHSQMGYFVTCTRNGVDVLKPLIDACSPVEATPSVTVRQIDVGSEHEVTLSYIVSPQEFYFHLKQEAEELEKLQQDLQAAAGNMSPLQGVPKPRELVMALYDDVWYRGRVTEDGCIYYCDYGNTEPFPDNKSDVRKIPADLQSRPDFAIKCCFADSQNKEWAPEAQEVLGNLLEEAENLSIQIKSVQQGLYCVDIPSVADKLPWTEAAVVSNTPPAQANLSGRLEALSIDEGGVKATIVDYTSPDDFYIHLESDADKLTQMAQRLVEADLFKTSESWAPGESCAALFLEDNLWYRATIVSSAPPHHKVRFVDYGNEAVTHAVRILPEDLINDKQPLAYHCAIPRPKDLSWVDEAKEKMRAFVDNETKLLVEFLNCNPEDGLYLVNIKSGDVDVNEELARASGFDHLVTSRKILSCNMEALTDISHVADTHVLSTIQEVTDDIENASEGCQRLSVNSPEKAVEDARIGDNETMVQGAAEERHVADVMFITSSNAPNSELSAVTDSEEKTTSLETVIEVCQKLPVAGQQEPDEVVILTNDISPMVQEVTEDTAVCSSVEVSIPSSTDVSNCDADDSDIANPSVETVIEVCQTLPGDGQQESDEVVIFTNDILPMIQEVTEKNMVFSLVEVSIPSSTEVSNCDADVTDIDEVTITSSTNMSNCDAIDDASISVETTTESCEDLSIPQRSDQVDIISDVLPTLQEVTEEVLVCATDEMSITSSTHLSNGDTEVCDTTHSSVESLIQGCQNLCIDDQKHDQAATDACEESSDEVEIVYESLSTIPVITIYDSEDDMKKLDEISLVVPEEKRNLSEDYIVSLDTYSRYQALELNEGGTCHGFVKATMQDFPVLSEINPGRTIYLFNDCEKHTVTVNVTST